MLGPVVFWAALLGLVYLGMLFLSSGKRDPVALTMIAVVGLLAIALAWNRWKGEGAQWFVRAAAAIGIAMLVPVMWQWLHRTDVFTTYCCRDKSVRPATFWPLLVLWGGTLAGLAFVLFGSPERWRALRRASPRSAAWWLAALLWTLAALFVFARNISGAVLWKSVVPLGKAGAVLAGVAAVLAALLWFGTRKTRRQREQVAADYALMPLSERQAVLDLVERAALAGEAQALYRFVEGEVPPDALARVNGDPLAHPGEAWPREDDGTPAWFLIQLPLDVPRLGPAWQRRVAVVFMADYELQVRTYAPADETDLVTLPNPGRAAAPPRFTLQRQRVPFMPVDPDSDEAGGFDVEQLPDKVPGLLAKLEPYSQQPLALLERILVGHPDFRGAGEDLIHVGGDPMLIQSEHEPACPTCGTRMRFLFQFGDPSDTGTLFGDAGVAYVYGCDAHPRECAGFVDCM
jgi:hypothetical protein